LSEAGNSSKSSDVSSLSFRNRACTESGILTAREVTLWPSRFRDFGDPTLSKAPADISVMPVKTEKSMPPPTARAQDPVRSRGAPGKAWDQMQHWAVLVGND
jgi:hypothetical protein